MEERDIYIGIIIVLGVVVITLMMCLVSEHDWKVKSTTQLGTYLNECWDKEITYHKGYETACLIGEPKEGLEKANWTKICENAWT
jgi:hypothetical protein